jgi:hypothetical protein
MPEGSFLAPLRGRWSTDERSRCQASEPPDLPIKLATINVDPVAPRGGLGGVYTIRSRQTSCRGMISGGRCTPSTTGARSQVDGRTWDRNRN